MLLRILVDGNKGYIGDKYIISAKITLAKNPLSQEPQLELLPLCPFELYLIQQ